MQGRTGLIRTLKEWAKRHWPAIRLRTLLLGVLIFVAGLPGLSAVFLRVYENALVRQTEAELVTQGAVMVALMEESWPGGAQRPPTQMKRSAPGGSYSRSSSVRLEPDFYQPERSTIDLRTSPVLPERPAPIQVKGKADRSAIIAAQKAAPVLFQAVRTTLAAVRVTDRAGIVVYGRQDLGGSYANIPEVRAALKGQRSTVLRTNTTYEQRTFLEAFSRGSTLRVHHARPILINGAPVGVLLLSRSPRGLFIGMYEDRGKIALGAIGIFLFLLFLVGLLTRGIARPIDQLAAATKGGARGVLDVPETPATAAVEIRELYANYRDMAARIEKRSRYLQDFAAAVSHEFKTPIAGIKGALELLGDHGETMSKADRKRFLTNANADADRLRHLVERLLDLARADMASGFEGVATSLAEPVLRVADAHRTKGFDVVVSIDADVRRVSVPAATIEAVVETLLENSRQAGAVKVDIAARQMAGAVILTVRDDGPGVPLGDRDRLFDPFFTSRRSEGGSGLGLAIARSLLAASDGGLALTQGGPGAVFEIRLPVA